MSGYIRKRSDGSWTIEASAGFDPVSGRRQRTYRTIRGTKKEATRALAALVAQIDNGTDLEPGRVKYAQLAERWLSHAGTRVRATTLTRYEQLLRLHVIPRIGALPLARLRPAHLQWVIDAMVEAGQSPRSIIQAYRVVSSSLRQARRWQLIATNPAEAIQPPRASRPNLQIPDAADLSRLLNASEGSVYEVPLTLAVASGLRRGELLALRWRDVDLDTGRITVNASLQWHKRRQRDGSSTKELVLVEPKTDRARRGISLPRFGLEALKAHRRAQNERRLALGEAWIDKGFVFDRGDGRPIEPDTFGHAFVRIASKAGLKGVRLHDVRHGYASTLLHQGVHPKVASEALGHASVAFTLDIYSHVVPGLQEAAAQALDDALGNRSAVKLPSSE